MLKKIILLMGIFLVLMGCSSSSNKQPTIPVQKSNLTVGMIKTKIVEGKTTQTEVIELFGAPNLITRNGQGNEVWTYNKSAFESSSNSSNIDWGLILLLGGVVRSESSVVSRGSTSSLDFIITFNKDGIVEKYGLISTSY